MGETPDFTTALLRGIQDPTRRRILELLLDPQDATSLAKDLEMSRPGVDKHLNVLMQNHLIRRQVEVFRGKPVYVYQTSENAFDLIKGLERLLQDYVEMTKSHYSSDLDDLEEDYLRGRISSETFKTTRKEIEEKLAILAEIGPLSSSIGYVSEAQKIVTDWTIGRDLKEIGEEWDEEE